MLAAIRTLQKTCMAGLAAPNLLSSGSRYFSELSRPSAISPFIRRTSDPMPAPWTTLHSFLRSVAARPVAVAAFGATTLGAGAWMASGHLGKRSYCASATAAGATPRSSIAPPPSSFPASASASASSSSDPTTTTTTTDTDPSLAFTFLAGASMIPHPAKVDKGGEDAFFICETGRSLGVADGVGGWAEIGIDPGLYSRELMAHAKDYAASMYTANDSSSSDDEEDEEEKEVFKEADGPQRILEYAHKMTTARGSCTACILCVHGATLHASNLGDSGFLVVRNGELAFMSPQQQHEFNFPYQLGSADSMADMPSAAQRFSMPVGAGDVVVAATDGVFDNIYPDEAAAMVTMAKKNGDSPEGAAALLAQFARSRAADPTHLSPFAYGAQQLGYRFRCYNFLQFIWWNL